MPKKTSKKQERWVAVSGGFDPMHVGHGRLLEKASMLGDRLVVILNNDNWLKNKKSHVFMPVAERKELLLSTKFVDCVHITNHQRGDKDMSVCQDLRVLRPAVFANGGDRGAANTPEAELCRELGIETVYNVGDGGKIQSSSWLIASAAEAMKTHERPWGSFKNHFTRDGVVHLKTLHVAPGAKLSLQRHRLRDEVWLLGDGDAQASRGETVESITRHELVSGKQFDIPVGMWHRLESRNGGVVVEVSYGTFDEDDIERTEDIYGRV